MQTLDTLPRETHTLSVSPGHTLVLVLRLQEETWQVVRPGEPLSATWEAEGYWWWLTRAKRTGHPVLCGQLPSIPSLFTLTTAQNHVFLLQRSEPERLQTQYAIVEDNSREGTQGGREQ